MFLGRLFSSSGGMTDSSASTSANNNKHKKVDDYDEDDDNDDDKKYHHEKDISAHGVTGVVAVGDDNDDDGGGVSDNNTILRVESNNSIFRMLQFNSSHRSLGHYGQNKTNICSNTIIDDSDECSGEETGDDDNETGDETSADDEMTLHLNNNCPSSHSTRRRRRRSIGIAASASASRQQSQAGGKRRGKFHSFKHSFSKEFTSKKRRRKRIKQFRRFWEENWQSVLFWALVVAWLLKNAHFFIPKQFLQHLQQQDSSREAALPIVSLSHFLPFVPVSLKKRINQLWYTQSRKQWIEQQYYSIDSASFQISHDTNRIQRFKKVPSYAVKKFHAEGRCSEAISRAFYALGWNKVTDVTQAHIVYKSLHSAGDHYEKTLEKWQRYSRIPYFRRKGLVDWEEKDGFLTGFRQYEKQTKQSLYFLPETYRLNDAKERSKFSKRLLTTTTTTTTTETGGGLTRPWVLKRVDLNNGHGVELLPPHSDALKTVVQRITAEAAAAKSGKSSKSNNNHNYIVQEYICNELTWFSGRKFDLRMFWMIASVDPPLVLYQDGYVRVAAGNSYNETDFSNPSHHLTNHDFRTTTKENGGGRPSSIIDDENVTADHLWRRLREHYDAHYGRLSKSVLYDDPVEHVRRQIKHAIAATAAAFFNNSFVIPKHVKPQNLFALYGADFILDADLDVYYLEAQSAPGCSSNREFRIDVLKKLYRPMIATVEEIARKQQQNQLQPYNLLPLENLGDWQVVYAGKGGNGGGGGTTTTKDHWMYTYKGYKRSKHKKVCLQSSSTGTTTTSSAKSATKK